MSGEHTENLNKARVQLIEQRREFARVLAGHMTAARPNKLVRRL